MAESDADPTDPKQFASATFAYLRRMENQMKQMMEILLRHDTRLGRVERDIGEVKRDVGELKRDVGEVKGDIVLLENKMLSQTNQILAVVERIDEHQQRLNTIAPSA
jgi:predicted  nucleic acid-binding Zn-ribbon protein